MTTYSITGPDGKDYSIEGPEGATREQVISKIKERQGAGYKYQQSEALTDIPSEIARTFASGLEKFNPIGIGQKGAIEGTLEAPGKVMGLVSAAASPVTGTLKSLIGHPTADLLHRIGSLIAPKIAEKETHQDLYKKTSEDVETALSAIQPGRSPVALNRFGVRTVAPIESRIEEIATKKVLDRIKQDEKTAGSAQEMIDRANASGKPMTLADVGGANVKGLAGNVLRQPGEGREIGRSFLNKRDEMAAARLSQDINKYVSGGPGVFRASEDLLKARSAASKSPYEDFFKLQNIWSPRLNEFFQDPVVRSGLKRGFEIERLHALAEGRPITTTQLGIDLDTEGNIIMRDVPNTRLLQMAKVGLDQLVADERDDLTGRLSARGVALDRVRRAFVDEIDSVDSKGIYKKARNTWAGPSASLDAIRAGRSLFSKSPDEIASEVADIAKRSPSDLEFYRLGVADKMRERLAKSGLSSDESKSIIKNPWMRAQLKPIFRSEEDFNKFVDSVTNELAMFETRRKLLGGSETAERLAEDANVDTRIADAAASSAISAATGHWFHAARNAYRMWRDLGLKPDPRVNQKISEILFATPIDKSGKPFNQLVEGHITPNRSHYTKDSAFLPAAPQALGALTQQGAMGGGQQ